MIANLHLTYPNERLPWRSRCQQNSRQIKRVTRSFIEQQAYSRVVFGRIVTLPGLVTWTFPFVSGAGRITTDYLAAGIALILVPLQFVVLLLIGYKLIQVVRANARKRAA